MEKTSSGLPPISGYLITLLIGLGIGFFIGKKAFSPTSSAAPAGDISKISYTGSDTISHHIGDSLARVLIAQYVAENTKSDSPLMTNRGERLRGFFIDRQPLDKILKDKTLDGISVYFAKDSAAHAKKIDKRMYTLIYTGGMYNKNYKPGSGRPRILAAGDTGTYDFVKPCPNDCGPLALTRPAPAAIKK